MMKDLFRYQQMHMYMEEGQEDINCLGFFALLDEFADNTATEHKLRDQHTDLSDLEQQVVDCLVTNPDLEKAKDLFPKFAEENEAHLTKEEDIMMPSVQKMVKAGVPVKKYIKSHLLPVLLQNDNMEFFLKFSNTILETYEAGGKMPKTRVFDQAVWSVASPEQWKVWDGYIRQSLSVAKYNQVNGAITAFDVESRSAWA